MPAYQDLLNEAFIEIQDFERHSADEEFQRQLCEVCMCILLLQVQIDKMVSNILFPAHVPLAIFDQLPIIDIYQGSDINHALPGLLKPISFRDQLRRDLLKGNIESVKYYKQSFNQLQDIPRTCFQIAMNLFGLRPGVTFDTELQLIYVSYVDINNLSDDFVLPNNFIQPFLRLMRMFLFMRLGRYQLAKAELERFKGEVE